MKNQIHTARMDGYTADGLGVCRIGGRAVFVSGALDGELWEVRIVRVTSGAVWARGEKLLEPSPSRTEPDCASFPRCGGCSLRHMRYDEELKDKHKAPNLRTIDKIDLDMIAQMPSTAYFDFLRAWLDLVKDVPAPGDDLIPEMKPLLKLLPPINGNGKGDGK